MDFKLTEEQEFIRDTIRRFIARECTREVARVTDQEGAFPEKLFKPIAELGFCGLIVPEAYGGGGCNVLGAVVVAEELSAVYPALAGAFTGCTFCGGKNISELGSEAQKAHYLPGIAQGDILFTCGLREPGTGYDRNAVTMSAKPNGKGYVLNGTKVFVRLADRADAILTPACTGESDHPAKGLSLFIVESSCEGLSVREMESVGCRSLSLCEVSFSDISVSAEDLLGGAEQLNRGREQWGTLRQSEDLEMAACGLGIAQGAYDYAVNYAKERVQFGKPIITFGAVKAMLIDMALNIRASRLLTYQAACLADEGRRSFAEASAARIFAMETARKASVDCLQVLGGYGYAMEYDAQRYVRDSLALLGGGCSVEILKEDMGVLLGLG